MKLLGYLLMTVFLCLGTIAATTAYVPAVDGEVEGLTLNAPAGAARLDQATLDAAKDRPPVARALLGVMRDRKIGKAVINYRLERGPEADLSADPGTGLIALVSVESPGGAAPRGMLALGGLSRRQVNAAQEAGAPTADAAPAPPRGEVVVDAAAGTATTALHVPPGVVASGDLATAMSYLSVISLDDETLATARLGPDGQVLVGDPGDPDTVPMALGNDRLSPEVLAALRGPGDARVRVKEFSFARWDMWWVFALSVVGLIVGGGLVKVQTKREIAAKAATQADSEESPVTAIARLGEGLRGLKSQLGGMTDQAAQLELIVETIGELQQTHIASVVAGRPIIIGRMGLSGFAEFMDRFSVAERQVNRAWSAAADGFLGESLAALDRAVESIPEAEAMLRA